MVPKMPASVSQYIFPSSMSMLKPWLENNPGTMSP